MVLQNSVNPDQIALFKGAGGSGFALFVQAYLSRYSEFTVSPFSLRLYLEQKDLCGEHIISFKSRNFHC